MSKNIINSMDDHMLLMSQLCYPVSYDPQIATQQGEAKVVRRRRKKNKVTSVGENDGPKKRKLSEEQVKFLEESFGDEHKLESERKDKLALELGLDPKQVAVWFQNRRARWKNKSLEEEYSKLKSVHENVVVEKCRLESEVLKLKEELSEREKEMKRLCKGGEGGVSSNTTSSSSLSMEGIDMPPYFGEFGGDGTPGYDEFFYVPDNNYVPGIDWVDLYM